MPTFSLSILDPGISCTVKFYGFLFALGLCRQPCTAITSVTITFASRKESGSRVFPEETLFKERVIKWINQVAQQYNFDNLLKQRKIKRWGRNQQNELNQQRGYFLRPQIDRDVRKGHFGKRNGWHGKASDTHQAGGGACTAVRIRLGLKMRRRLRASLKETLALCCVDAADVCYTRGRIQVAQNHIEARHRSITVTMNRCFPDTSRLV